MSRIRAARRALVHALLPLGIALGLAAPAGRAWADAVEPARQSFEVPAGALEDALNSFARQAGITLSFDPARVRGRAAPALAGDRTVDEGLAALLAPHGLEAVRSSGGAYLIRPSTTAPPPSTSHEQLPAVVVTAEAERADGPVDGYVARRSATATKTDTPIVETPRSITVVTRNQMDDQAVQTAEQSLRYSAGVLTEVTGYDLRFSSLTVRGFAPAEFLDGFKLTTSSPYTGWLAEPQGLERVELLRGPSAALYDQTVPGGAINMVSKRPTAQTLREVSLSVGNHDRYQGSLDLGGTLNADGSLLFRLNAVLRNSGSQTDFGRDDRSYIAPALTWKPSSRTTVTLLADATRDRMTPKSAWPQYALVVPNPNGQIPVNRFIGEPGVDHYDRETSSLTYLLSHRIDDNWTFRQNARYSALNLDYLQISGTAFRDDQRTLDRSILLWRDRIRVASIDNQIEGRLRTGSLDHTLLVGMDLQRYSSEREGGQDLAPPIDAFAPVYDLRRNASLNGYLASLRLPQSTDKVKQFGVYVQDQIRSGPWSASLAVRHDRAESQASPNFGLSASDSKTTYNAGLLYVSESGLNPYASYATSFTPVPGVGTDGLRNKPELGRQFEVGLKYRPPGMDALFTLSAFDLRKNNVTTSSPLSPGFTLQIGEVRTSGPEFEARASLTEQIKMVASVTLLNAKVTRSLRYEELGKQPTQTARKTAALWLDYRFANPELQGWSIGGGVRYVDKVPADVANTVFNPAYTLVDAALRYDRGPYSFALNATNLFDKRYVSGLGQFFGQGRTLQAKATYRW
ncbi:TonB-dependent siderophore receptor [Variovorax sp. ZS18.2.2]|uniref:TonB-dependent siderophore receptor n=1 Tax=Variovorax sp. ZS18.2.2 TaxID=2971255 RepID=UPI0021512806|nr:TonB-dependent siderophore receptor [Variovorax sp. ZS18.2.2]MCR6478531.1 TonB-dependent siderophore receptor [Variovorax sp. ZS18.2.2]